MKKILSILLMAILLLCSCSKAEKPADDNGIIEINYDIISRRNNRQTLMRKYDFIKEEVCYYNLDTKENVSDWTLQYYKQEDGNINAKFVFGDEVHYYYNNNIFVSFDEQDPSYVIPFKSNYISIIKSLLKRENTLNYVFHNQTEGFNFQNGYAVSYIFTLTQDVLNEFVYWNVHVGDKLKVDYTLNEDYEILNYSYYIVETSPEGEESYIEIMTSKTTFNEELVFPEYVYQADEGTKHNLTVIENYMKTSEIKETFTVPDNFKIWGDYNLVKNDVYIDEENTVKWDFEKDKVTSNLTLYLVPDPENMMMYYN